MNSSSVSLSVWQRAVLLLFLGSVLGGLFVGSVVHAQVQDTTRMDTLRNRDVPPRPTRTDSARAQHAAPPDTGKSDRAIVNADSLSAIVRDGQRLQELFRNVDVTQDTTRLRSNYALRYLGEDRLLFTGDVVIFERGDTLRADTVRYNKRTKVGYARSNVRLTDGEVVVRAPRATYFTEEKRSVFPDSVTLVDSARVLRAQEGTYWSNERRAEFQGRVRLTDPDSYLESDSLTYFRDTERSIASGNVFIRRVGTDESIPGDTSAVTYLFGEWADNQEQNRYSRVERNAVLVRVRRDSTGAPADTLAVEARRLEAHRTDTYRRLVAVDSVQIWQPDMSAVADSAVYDRVVATGSPDTTATPDPVPDVARRGPSESTRAVPVPLDSLVARATLVRGPLETLPPTGTEGRPDSASAVDPPPVAATPDTTGPPPSDQRGRAQRPGAPLPDSSRPAAATRSGQRAGGSGWGTPSVQSEDNLPLEETRLFEEPITWFERSQVWGDSIRVRARNRSIDTVYVRGAAFAAQEDTTVDRIRQLKGKDITAYFENDSLRTILARPNGQAIHFTAAKDGTLNGATRASADVVTLHFRGGDLEKINFVRGVQGTAYHKREHIPDPFRLEGFQWTPERRPTRASLLGRDRVRRRLNLEPLERSSDEVPPPVAGSAEGGARPAADSTTQSGEFRERYGSSGSTSPGTADVDSLAAPDSLAVPADSVRSSSSGAPARDTSNTSSSGS